MTDPTLPELSKQIGDMQTAMNIVWTLLTGFLVMFMQAGFALLETGLTRAKNVAHTMGMNIFVYAIGILCFWAVGYALQMGGVGALATMGNDATLSHEFSITLAGKEFGLFGLRGFFLAGATFTPAVATLFLFQMVFMDTAATIPTGAMAERWKFLSFVAFSCVVCTVIYPLYANWVWGGGWLANLGKNFGLGHGHCDFAGSSVVHMTGGVMAFVGAKMIGPRIGKYGKDGSVKPIPGHNIPMAVLGTLILAFGWFGFNPGSTLASGDTRVAIVAANTMLASASSAMAACFYVWMRYGKPDVTMICNGLLAGLVAITAPCAFVSAPASILIGAIAGVVVVIATVTVEHKAKVDDPVGAVAVHGVCGAWGILALGIFANGTYGDGLNGVEGPVRGLLYGDKGQFVAECIGLVTNIVYVAPLAALTLFVIEKTIGNRVSSDTELNGLDEPEMGMPGYWAEPGRSAPPELSHQPAMAGVAQSMSVVAPQKQIGLSDSLLCHKGGENEWVLVR